jgi:signal transduction histidine kinase
MPLATVLVITLFADTAPPVPARATPLLIFIPIMIVGDAVHRWARRAGDSGARLRQAQAEHEAATRRVLALERARLASELHDVVTHNVSMMVVQAGAARRVLSADPVEATKAMRAVESSGRTAMTELRHLLGLLSPPPDAADVGELAGQPAALLDAGSSPDGAADLAPQPGLDELREMVGGVVTAGLPVELHITGTPRDLPSGLGLAVFRVVQEALTNVIKHAGRPRTEVRLTYEPAALMVEVADDGRPIPAAGPAPDVGVPRGAGMGLLGLRERVALYGGELAAGLRPGGGWLVWARIPAEPAETPAEIPVEAAPP